MNRYRVATLFLYVPFIGQLAAWLAGSELREMLPTAVSRSIYWAGLGLLTLALALDAWEVYRGKRQVNRLIAAKWRDRSSATDKD
jgi:putative effector of murein hydrolase LrgA (UPF0299 family)